MRLLAQMPVYPYLLSIYFVLFVFSENLGEVFLHQLMRPLAAVTVATMITVAGCWLVFRTLNRGSFVAVLLLAAIYLHSGIEQILHDTLGAGLALALTLEAVTVVVAITAATLLTVRWSKLNPILNLVLVVLVTLTAARIGTYTLSGSGPLLAPQTASNPLPLATTDSWNGVRRDVYYVLVDAYTRSDTLQDYFGHDNSEFLNFLRSAGFVVADRSVANYPYTPLAVNTVMNLDYVADEDGFIELSNNEPLTFNRIIADNPVAGLFSKLGYRIFTVRSVGNYITAAGAHDRSYADTLLSNDEFERALLNTTLLPRVFRNISQRLFTDQERVDFSIDEVARLAGEPGPKLVIAHIMAPHQPFIYDRDGNLPTHAADFDFNKLAKLPQTIRAYRNQVYHLNQRLKTMIRGILDASEIDPIIVIQGDHGLRITNYLRNEHGGDTADPELICAREMFSNLNAMYLPGTAARQHFYPSISPVNTFRLILDNYFGTQLGLVPDRTLLPLPEPGARGLEFNFHDITEYNESCSPFWEQQLRNARLVSE